jgi:hypothetical protein
VIFRDRTDAAQQLAKALAAHQGKNPLVLAIPRGAVPMGLTIGAEQTLYIGRVRQAVREGMLDPDVERALVPSWTPSSTATERKRPPKTCCASIK